MTGEQIYNKVNSRLGCKYKLGALVPKDDPNYRGPFDCAELATWGVFQATGWLYGASDNSANPHSVKADAYTGFWYRDAKKLGIIISITEAKRTKGAFLLRVAANGSIGHIVCSDGNGGTSEAHSTKYGCINSFVDGRRWDFGVLIPDVEYSSKKALPQAVKPHVKIYRWIEPVMISNVIGSIQRQLAAKEFYKAKVDNVFGEMTWKAVRAFQLAEGLTVDGEVGPETARELGITL